MILRYNGSGVAIVTGAGRFTPENRAASISDALAAEILAAQAADPNAFADFAVQDQKTSKGSPARP